MDKFKYVAERGMRFTSTTQSLSVKTGTIFYIGQARKPYLTLDPVATTGLFLNPEQVQKLEQRSKRARVKPKPVPPDAEIVIKHVGSAPVKLELNQQVVSDPSRPSGLPAFVRPTGISPDGKPFYSIKAQAPSVQDLLSRIDSSALAPTVERLVDKDKPHFTHAEALKFLTTNRVRIEQGFTRIIERNNLGRSRREAETPVVQAGTSRILVYVDSEIGHDQARLSLSMTVNPTGHLSLNASVSTPEDPTSTLIREARNPDPKRVFRAAYVKSFFKEFLKLGPKFNRSFGLPMGQTVGPFSMKGNTATPYLAVTRYLHTAI